jgi:hypothetical protein
MAQAFITKKRLKEFDKVIGQIIDKSQQTLGLGAEQAIIIKNLLHNREYLGKEGDVVKVTIPGPERVVEGLVSLIGDSWLTY